MYESGKEGIEDVHCHILGGKINDMMIQSIDSRSYNPVVLLNDQSMQVLGLKDIKYFYSFSSVPLCMVTWNQLHKETRSLLDSPSCIVVGLSNGSIECLQLKEDKANLLWAKSLNSTGTSKAVILLKSCNYFKTGYAAIVLVRQDSSVEILRMLSNQSVENVCTFHFNEAITSIDYGFIYPAEESLLISTFSGRIIALVNTSHLQKENQKITENPKELDKKIKALQSEIDSLQKDLETVRMEGSKEVFSEFNTFKAKHTITKTYEDNSFVVLIESQVPLEQILLQSTLPIIVPDSHPAAICCRCPVEPESNVSLIMNFNITESNLTRFELKMTVIEGKLGSVHCFLIPQVRVKTCFMMPIDIKPLALHERIYSVPEGIPLNTLKLSGEITRSQMLSWLNLIIPEIPQTSNDEVKLSYCSLFVGSHLLCDVKDKVSVFQSDLISTLMIIKDLVMGEANKRNMNISINWNVDSNCFAHIIQKLTPKFEAYSQLETSFKLIGALKEVENQVNQNQMRWSHGMR